MISHSYLSTDLYRTLNQVVGWLAGRGAAPSDSLAMLLCGTHLNVTKSLLQCYQKKEC